MNLTARVILEEQELLYRQSSYVNNPIKEEENPVIEGYFYQANR